ncbi:N-acetyl-gamma-glutamyl-phosphate reductase [Bacillus carboniphilus]|uniref:N-acetyl-gamma-glutamyl-phosphate reductase n=1 Tax=Bacillus carboniphilus TaxID=86663 RepID=A0ABY9JVW2_9BACI|nr:N-acetyl-gamma-glutamyl-phosphate reductase [Bacillus carboniphilus]WLR42929.1 N-acetyl-gamma-glutamyl-phosphate reductase [Bacillus carboniphilus]
MKVGIIGATGYGGIEVYRFLQKHKNVHSCKLLTTSQQDIPYANVYPHLHGISDENLNLVNEEKLKEELDVIFLATPSGVSTNLTPRLINGKAKIIDLSGDLRIKNQEQYESYYQKKYPPKEVIDQAVYGLSEVNREAIKDADLIANPGCYPTASLLGLYPLVNEGLIRPSSIIIDAKSGLSGAGKTPSLVSSFTESNENLRIYKVHEHQHTPEIEQLLQSVNDQVGPITFSTHLIPMTRGIMSTIYVELHEAQKTNRLKELYQSYYSQEPFIRIRKEGQFPSTKEVAGTNYCDISLKYDPRSNRLLIVSVIDNLVKGAAGQAVQNMNLMFGIEETEGLVDTPIYP